MMKLIIGLVGIVLVSCNNPAANKTDLQKPPDQSDSINKVFYNPLLTDGPDPWVIRKNGYYYQMNTLGNRIGIRKTKYMSKLGFVSLITVWRPPTFGPNAVSNIWAPELHNINGYWFLYFAATPKGGGVRTHRIYVLKDTSKDPTKGNWIFKGEIADSNADYYAIDATVFEYHDSHYLLWSGDATKKDHTQRIYIAKMKNSWTLATPRVLIASPTYSWEGSVDEAPEILKSPKGRVFLTFSAFGCGSDNYALGMMSLKKGSNPLKPSNWTKKPQPVFTKYPAHHTFGPGHNAFFKSPDGTQYWIIYHANSKPGQGCDGHRSTRMQQIHWNKDGTPNFGRPVNINTPLSVPSRNK